MMIKLRHLRVLDVAQGNVFTKVTGYDSLNEAILSWGLDGGKIGSENYNDRVGASFEVYTEFFASRYGTPANPLLGITNVKDTSQNKFQCGYDFDYEDLNGARGLIQAKWRNNPLHLFTIDELGKFITMADGEGVTAARRVLFTNLEHKPSDTNNGVFHFGFKHARNQMRVIGRSQQEEFIDRDPTFWSDLLTSVIGSAKAPTQRCAPNMRLHQLEAFESIMQVFQ